MRRTEVPAEYRQATGDLATEKQVAWLTVLVNGKDLSPLSREQIEWLANADYSKIPKKRCGDVIAKLVELTWKPKRDQKFVANGNEPSVPFGRYAVEKDDGTLMFYSVKYDWETKGQRVFVWASSEQWPITNPEEKLRVLKLIAADPREAMNRFGQEIGRCGRCGRVLTRQSSRDRGLGPDCAEKMSW